MGSLILHMFLNYADTQQHEPATTIGVPILKHLPKSLQVISKTNVKIMPITVHNTDIGSY